MKRIIIFAFIILIISASACVKESTDQNGQTSAETTHPREPEGTATLYVDFTLGASDLILEQYEFGYNGDLTPEILLEGLSSLTGLDFIADITMAEHGIEVDWKKESSLIAGFEGRQLSEPFLFNDEYVLRWFMMDSLYRTLLENFRPPEVYYTMDGGQTLQFDALYPVYFVNSHTADTPYAGSQCYFAVGSLWQNLEGVWKLADNGDSPYLYFGYNEENKPVSYLVWGYEKEETKYVTEASVIDGSNYSVTYYTPENTEEGLFEIHDAYYEVRQYDMSDYINGKLTIIAENGAASLWEYAGTYKLIAESSPWEGTYMNADGTKSLDITANFGGTSFSFTLSMDGADLFGTAEMNGDTAAYMDIIFALSIRGDDISVWIDEPQEGSHEREIFKDTYFRSDDIIIINPPN